MINKNETVQNKAYRHSSIIRQYPRAVGPSKKTIERLIFGGGKNLADFGPQEDFSCAFVLVLIFPAD